VRVYVAAKYEERARLVPEVYAKLREGGHVITHDWTGESDDNIPPREIDAYHAACASDDIDGVMRADALVLLPHERGKGLYVELGIAFARKIPVICWKYDGELPDCIFLMHPDVIHVESMTEVVETLFAIEHQHDEEKDLCA
jgi:nucleoside 2-deoxyribosyltransferase